MNEPPTPEQTSGEHDADEELLGVLAEDFLARYRRGERPSLEEYIQKHPSLADGIRDLFPAMLALEQSGSKLSPGLPSEQVGAVIGGYKLLERIGEGGFGVVFMAEQTHPIRRKVALKVIKPGVDTKQVIARFEAERQALAMMDHDNIAKVFEAGATESGRPFFVMELVQGVPITDHCDRNNLSPRERLELFVQVCRAVQHAHTKGIIHRDIKPTNVLVTLHDGVPVPKIIDFGIAKATSQQLTEKTLFTNFAQMVGTPLYMSPEQAEMSGLDADTRSDIYSLGVMLYELLTGTTPVDHARLKQAAFDEVRRIIREEVPPRPSTRLSTMSHQTRGVSAQRTSELKKLGLLVRGELDWIVMKCLEKDRSRRYETANLLATDLQRYLSGEAVLAAPPSAAYRFRKFARRNKRQVIAVATIFVVLLAGIVGTTMGMIGQARQRAIAERQRLLAEAGQREAEQQTALALAVVQFQFDMFASPSPSESGDKVTVLEVMAIALKQLDAGKLKDQPLAEANVRDMIGGTFHALGRYAEAETVLRKGLALRRSVSKSPWWIAYSIQSLAITLSELGKREEAEALMREALQLRRGILPAGDPLIAQTMERLGLLLQVQGKYAESESLCREALAIQRQAVPVNELHVATSLGKLGWLLQIEEKFAEAETLCREALDIRRRNLPPAHPNVAESLNHLAVVLARTGRLAESEPLFREMLEIDRTSLPAGHPRIGQDLTNLAIALQEQGKLDEAEPLHREGLKMRRDSLPTGHIYIAQSLESLAALLRRQGKFVESETLTREALTIRRNGLPPGHPDTADAAKNLGLVLRDQEKFAEAEAALLEAEQMLAAAPGLPGSTHDRCVEALVAFYSQWHASSPGNGYDAKAHYWKAKLPTTTPATTRSR